MKNWRILQFSHGGLHASEQIWCGYFLTMALLADGKGLTWSMIGLAIAVLLAARWLPLRWRLMGGLAWLNLAYALGSDVAKSVRVSRYDDELARIDALLGWHQGAWIPAPLTLDVLSCFYVSFYLLLVAAIVLFQRRPAFYTGFALVFATGTLCYVLVPAAGPFFDWPLPTAGTHVFVVLQGFASNLVTGVDVFPSLHVAASGYVLACMAARWPRAMPLFALWALGIAVATVGLRYHYLIDVIAGVLLIAVVLVTLRPFDAGQSRALVSSEEDASDR